MARWLGGAILATLLVGVAQGHFHMLLPATPSAKVGQEVLVTVRFGHPFEHQMFDCARPERLVILTPDGKSEDMTKQLKKTAIAGDKGKKVSAYQLRYTPKQRGDHVLVLLMPPVWMEEDEAYVQDSVKVVLHVQAQKGWDAVTARQLEWQPLTRPYGLEPGMVFQAQLVGRRLVGKKVGRGDGTTWHGTLVEIERYNDHPPRVLPPEVHITRTAMTTTQGIVTTTLTDPGWWSLTTTVPGNKTMKRGDKDMPVHHRATLWVHVDRKPGTR